MSDLIEFLRARLDEDERYAVDVRPVVGLYASGPTHAPGTVFAEVEVYGPGRARAEVAAKRAIIDMCTPGAQYPDFSGGYESAWEDALHHLAGVYRDHPDWREEWAA